MFVRPLKFLGNPELALLKDHLPRLTRTDCTHIIELIDSDPAT
jgi:hypothetical protein